MADGVKGEIQKATWPAVPGEWMSRWNRRATWVVDEHSIHAAIPNQTPIVIRFDEIAKVRLSGRLISRFEVIAQDGRSISCRFSRLSPQHLAVLDAIAARVPHRAVRESSAPARKAEKTRFLLKAWASGLSVCAGILLTYLAIIMGSAIALALGVGSIGLALLVLRSLKADGVTLQKAPADSPTPLTRRGWLAVHKGHLPRPEWQPGSQLRYIPDDALENTELAVASTVLILGVTAVGFCISAGFPALVVVLFCCPLLPLASYVRRLLWIRARRDDRFKITKDTIELTRKGRTIHAAPHTMVTKLRSPDQNIFGQYGVFTGPEGRIECDYRYLWPVDRPLYEPESPWEELWRVE